MSRAVWFRLQGALVPLVRCARENGGPGLAESVAGCGPEWCEAGLVV